MAFENLPDFVGKIRTLPLKKDTIYKTYLKSLKNKEVANIALICCSDYSYDIDNSGWVQYNHKKLNSGEGMMACAYSLASLQLITKLSRMGIPIRLLLFYGDNEAYDLDILKRLKITKKEFLAKTKQSMSTGRTFYQNLIYEYFPKNDNIDIHAFSIQEVIYENKKVNVVAQKRLKTIRKKDLEHIVSERKEVISSMYGIDLRSQPDLFIEKAKTQIFDRLIVGSYFSEQIDNQNSWSLFTLTPPSLKPWINYKNRKRVTIFSLGN